MELFVFAVFALAALASAVVVVLHRNPVYSTMSLVVTLLATAGLFVLLGSPFLAALQVLLYTGAILVLFLFVIMLLNIRRERSERRRSPGQLFAAFVCSAFLLGMVGWLLWGAHGEDRPLPLRPENVALHGVAREIHAGKLHLRLEITVLGRLAIPAHCLLDIVRHS